LITHTNQTEIVINKENEAARQLLKEGKKKQALIALKKKKYQEQLLDKAEKQLSNIQEMVHVSIWFTLLILPQRLIA
jgi:charged multivesicular body protein 6